jgi:hypothetical protein
MIKSMNDVVPPAIAAYVPTSKSSTAVVPMKGNSR